MIENINDAQHEVWAMASDMAEDLGCSSDDIDARDVVVSVCFNIDNDDLARELCRVELGWVPFELEPRLGEKDWVS